MTAQHWTSAPSSMARSRALEIIGVLLVLVSLVVPAAAQVTTGTVTGTIKDEQGGVVPGAAVTLISETKGTASTPVVSNEVGTFVLPNVSADTYTIQVEMPSFKTLKRPGVEVSAGERVSVGALSISIGAVGEVVMVTSEAPMIQASSGERSFNIAKEQVENLPIANRSFTAVALLAPGVQGTTAVSVSRLGGGGATNIMMDGVSTLNTGNNGVLIQMPVESIGEVKVLTSGYQAEYGRSSGLQITATTKSGTNQFRGAGYDIERNSDWNANSKTNILNGDPKPVVKERDWGFSIGGPIGRPGGNNKLFFFYSEEWEPRTVGGDTVQFRVPTALERSGDFSRSYDNLGNLYPYIKDPSKSGACDATSQAACFADGGLLGKIPASALYPLGLNILKMYPMPNVDNAAGLGYNLLLTRPTQSLLSTTPVLKVDYQPSSRWRASAKYGGWRMRNDNFLGLIPGFDDTQLQHPVVHTIAVTANAILSSSLNLEVTYGHSGDDRAGCTTASTSSGPTVCRTAIATSPQSNINNVGLGDFPNIFPDANLIDPRYYAGDGLSLVNPPYWVNGRVLKVPNFSYGTRVANAPPNFSYPAYLNINRTQDFAASLLKVLGNHTFKGGFYLNHSFKAENLGTQLGTVSFQNDTVGTNPFDTSFGFANAAIGAFSSYQQASKYTEINAVYNQIEGYLQDNWKVNQKLTLDYGLRFVHPDAVRDVLNQESNFLPETWVSSQAPRLYVAGCANGVYPCSGTNRQAMDPLTGAFLGPNTTLAIGSLVPSSGNKVDGLLNNFGDKAGWSYPKLKLGPRFGTAYDLTGTQKYVLRGSAGVFYDRASTSQYYQVANPPNVQNVTIRFGQLQTLKTSGVQVEGAPAMTVVKYHMNVPTSVQWNAGMQTALPHALTLDVSYVGQHSWNGEGNILLNSIDLGAAFLPANQDRTLAASTTAGASAIQTDLMRPFVGYGAMTQRADNGWRTYHSIQLSLQRRFTKGLSLGFTDAIQLVDKQNSALRLQHASDGTISVMADQAQADALLGDLAPQTHFMRANFVWDLPDLHQTQGIRRALGFVANDWQLSGLWNGATSAAYTIGYSYQSGGGPVNLTGSPDFAARVRVVGDPGNGCTSNLYKQFTTTAFAGPLTGSNGLESGTSYVRGCFTSQLDLSVARNIRVGGNRSLQLRIDMFNAPNSAIVASRSTTMNLSSPNDPTTITNLPYDTAGNLIASRATPRGNGFGVATGFQTPRNIQLQARFSF